MLRLTRGAQKISPWSRNYSEGFEISKYLSRIEAITKSKGPVAHKPRQPRKSSLDSKYQTHAKTATNDRSAAPGRRSRGPGTPSAPGKSRPPLSATRRPSALRQTRPPLESTQEPQTAQTRNMAPRASASSNEVQEWASLDTFTDARSAKASPRQPKSGRRVSLRSLGSKPGSRPKTGKGARSSRDTSAASKGSSASDAREYVPYLTPKEALEVVLRNEGTSTAGFIGPVDVSLQTLQPSLVHSAVTYNSRVRSLLNSIPAGVAHDNKELAKLVGNYVSGDFEDFVLKPDANQSLTLQSLASEVSANPSMSPTTKQFFARVGAGQLTPKQIVDRA